MSSFRRDPEGARVDVTIRTVGSGRAGVCAGSSRPRSCGSTLSSSVKPAGVTFNLAQVLDWIGEGVFAVGRWDGTISVFRVPGQMNSVR